MREWIRDYLGHLLVGIGLLATGVGAVSALYVRAALATTDTRISVVESKVADHEKHIESMASKIDDIWKWLADDHEKK